MLMLNIPLCDVQHETVHNKPFVESTRSQRKLKWVKLLNSNRFIVED